MKIFELNGLKSTLEKSKNIVIVAHKNPDGDAVGSSLGLSLLLKEVFNNKNIQVVLPNRFPEFLEWLPKQEQILFFDQNNSEAKKSINNADLIFTLDFNSFGRTGEMSQELEQSKADFVMIDHHQQPDDYAKFSFSDTSIGSTCEMIYLTIQHLGYEKFLTKEVGECIYTGIMTDTGSFKFSSTSSQTHRIIADLIDLGVENSKIHQNTFDNNSLSRLQLMGIAMNNLKVIAEKNAAYITLSQEELDLNDFKKGDTEGFVNYALSLKGINLAVIFIENKSEGIIKISLRSIGDIDVNTLARKYFNGGGHQNAAGGRSELSMSETITKFEKILTDEF
ncbi:DHH family phosphoesterase [Psychroflexus halocasei]|uniref:Phosphoesterase RecJ domain-containing protein n=1 Tax=Psychroflexus halocasei TaxID=908615 RepID=A0A1H3YEZ3_9FLAO|nr:bifunctional oligoribonuclease/PAP phosphatase NrnA [Psychroflexus halocasei]SEA10117.1 phosphoesterase RecJ domain-containing protein [Psychroflexus halocasei]